MSFWSQIEAEYQAVVDGADNVFHKLEALVGIHQRAAERQQFETQLGAILADTNTDVTAKEEAILTLFGK